MNANCDHNEIVLSSFPPTILTSGVAVLDKVQSLIYMQFILFLCTLPFLSCTLTKWEVGLFHPLPWYIKWQMKIAFSRFQLRNYIQISEMQWKWMQFACTSKDSWSDWQREREGKKEERMECKRRNCNLINYILNIYSSSFPPSPSDNSSFLPHVLLSLPFVSTWSLYLYLGH